MLSIQNTKPWWTLLLPLVALTAMLAGAPHHRLWMAPVSALAYMAMQWIFPKCRFRSEHYFSPVNVALFLMLLKLVAVPALIVTLGPESPVLLSLPALASMEAALAIDTIAFVALCLGLHYTSEPRTAIGFRLPPPSVAITMLFAIFGLLGFVAEFGSIDRMFLYFTGPTVAVEIQQDLDGTLTGLLGTFLRPFFAFSLIALWTRLADHKLGTWQVTLYGIVAAIGITLANMTFNFNRAAFVFPLITLIAVYHDRIRRIPLAWTAGAAMIALPALLMVSTYRTNLMTGTDANGNGALDAISENIQGYAVGPQYTGLFYDRIGWGDHLYLGTTLVASAMSPVPILGKNFRDANGPALFNRAIYGVSGIEDQILPFATELFANFHIVGVVAGFIALGFLIGKTEQWIHAADSSFAAFALQYAAIWTAMLTTWSVSIYAQILIYFFGPIYVYLFSIHLREWLKRTTAAPRWETAQ